MIQLNLLPEVKLKYINAKRTRRTIIAGSLLVSASLLVLVAFTFSVVQGLQRKNIRDLSADIASEVLDIQSIPDLNKILTVQNQLGTLPELHESKLVSSRLFGFVNQTTPNDVSIARLELNTDTNQITVNGISSSIAQINQYVDTLKFSEYVIVDKSLVREDVTNEQLKASAKKTGSPFKNVVSALSRSEDQATFTVTFGYELDIFSVLEEGDDIVLIVPNIITTRSETQRPSNLFEDIDISEGSN